MSGRVQITPKTPAPATLPPVRGGVLQRKCACGGTPGPTGECTGCQRKRLLGKVAGTPQAKLRVNEPGDQFEQEADRVATAVLNMSAQPAPSQAVAQVNQDEEMLLHPKPVMQRQMSSTSGQTVAPPLVHEVLNSPGRPLDPMTRTLMESRFGYDFSRVRVHTETQAAQSAQAVHARAYTVGQHLVFDRGQYAPQTTVGRYLLAHELTHVVQQTGMGFQQVQRATFNVGTLTIQVDYGGLTTIPAADWATHIITQITNWTGSAPSSTVQSSITALTSPQQEWVMLGLRLLRDNTTAAHSALNRAQAVDRLIAHAPSAVHRPLGSANLEDYAREVLRVAGWFEVALTTSLSAPTGATQTAINLIVNPPPTSGSPGDPLDVAILQARIEPALRHLLQQIDPANWTSVGTRSISTFQALGDVLIAEARTFFRPFADTAMSNIFDLQPAWHASANIFDVTATSPTRDQRLGYLLNRAEIVGRNTDAGNTLFNDTNIFADAHFDGSRAADRQELFAIVNTLEGDAAVQATVDRLIQHTGRKSGQGASTQIGLVTEFNAASTSACTDHWRGIDTLCHELLHALVHPNFVVAATGVGFPQVIREGFTEVLGVQLFNDHIVPKANRDASFKATLESGVTGAPCPTPAAATIGYGDAGSGAEEIRRRVGNNNFRAAYFLGRPDLVGF